MMKTQEIVKVLRPGTAVVVGGSRSESFFGLVTGAAIYGGQDGALRTVHQVSWWNGRTHVSEWLEDFEISPAEGESLSRAGFR